jgi:hypothetical protein
MMSALNGLLPRLLVALSRAATFEKQMVRVMASIALAALWAATAASAQVPQCEDTSVTVQEDSLLQIMVACTDGGYLRDLAVDHIASVVGSGGPAMAAPRRQRR